MRLKVHDQKPGLHPSEVVVGLQTTSGKEWLVVHKRSISAEGIDIGFPISSGATGDYLVELPRETQSGSWRVRVPKDQVA